MLALQILTYVSIVVFIVMIISKGYRIAKAPVHLRWELYPVPHERGRSAYGGSRLEEVDWWTKDQKKDHINEWKEMAQEILLMKGVREHNESLWLGSFPFHLGLYFYIGNVALILIAAILSFTGVEITISATGIELVLFWVVYLAAWIGAAIGVFGSLRLLFLRIVDRGMAAYSTPSHYFNIILIGAIFATALLWLISDKTFISNAGGYVAGIITFSQYPSLPVVGILNIVLTLAFLIYLPFTHMTHFFTKYFIYHNVRWEDAPNVDGHKMQQQISELLNQPVSWSAPHIAADGKRTWLAVATEPVNKPEEEENK